MTDSRSGPISPVDDGTADPAARVAPDVRLAGVAAGTWLAALAALRVGSVTAMAAALAAAAIAGVVGWLLARADRSGDRAARPNAAPRWGWAVLAVLLGAACGAAVTAVRVAGRDAEPLAGLANRHAAVRVELVVRDDPRQVGGTTGRLTLLVPAVLVRVGAAEDTARRGAPEPGGAGRGSVIHLRARVLVLANGPGWAGLLPGQRIAASGRLSPARGGDLSAAVLSVTDPPRRLGRPGWAQRAAGRLRAGLRQACAPLPDEPGGLLPGLVVGDTSRLPPAVAEDFRSTGLTHLNAVSGANVAIVVGFVLLLVRWAGAGPRTAAVACTVALVGFVILVRPSPSVLRAAAMGAIGLLALATGRARAAVPALSTAVTVLVVVDPELAGHAGFALSVLATGGLLLLAPRWRDAMRARGVPAGAAEALAVPAAAQVACGPVVAALSGSVSAVAVPANLLAVPAVAPATVLGVAAAVVSPVWPAGAAFLAWLGGWPARWLVLVARHGADVPGGTLPWLPGALGGLLLAAVTVAFLAAGRWPVVRRLAAVVVSAAVLGAWPVRLVASGWPPDGWAVVVCAVGQGDAAVLPAGEGRAVVIDAGAEPASTDRCLRRLGVRQIELLVVSHFHADHVGGVDGVFRGRRVGGVVTTAWPEPAAGRAQVNRAMALGMAGRRVTAGWSYRHGGLRLTAIGPVGPLHGTRSDPNNNSLVLYATVGGLSILLAGDAEGEEQRALLERSAASPADGGRCLRAQVLKLPHHGSVYQDPGFLGTVHPAVVLVSVGAGNRYGHPNPSVLGRLARDGARILRTDVDGDIAAVRSGRGLAVAVRGRDPGSRPP